MDQTTGTINVMFVYKSIWRIK